MFQSSRSAGIPILCWLAISAALHAASPPGGLPRLERARLGKQWRISQIQLHSETDQQETASGIVSLLRKQFVEGRDYVITVYDAHADPAVLPQLVDTAISRGTDMVVAMSTPVLQAALKRTKDVPVVFTRVTSGVLAGAGKSNTDHAPNVTGVQIARDYDRMVRILKACLPSVVSIGTLVKDDEINVRLDADRLAEAAKSVGLQVVTVPVKSIAGIEEASHTLMKCGIGAVCQVPTNFLGKPFESLMKVARAARIPIFSFQADQAALGAAVTLAPEGLECGKDTAHVMIRIMRGESPASIPFQNFTKDEFFINPRGVEAAGMVIPAELMKQAALLAEP